MCTLVLFDNPFSDSAVECTIADDSIFDICRDDAVGNEIQRKTATRPDMIVIPMLKTLSPISLPDSQSTVSTLSLDSTAPSSSTTSLIDAPISWNSADLMYLLSCLFPDEILTNRLLLVPDLEDLDAHSFPTHLQLFVKMPIVPIPATAYSRHAPIGTGRPRSKILIATSLEMCNTAQSAQRSLAHALLRNAELVGGALDQYNVLDTLYRLSTQKLQSVERGMRSMACVSTKEWQGRLRQLRGFARDGTRGTPVDASCSVEARLEMYLLEMGRAELDGWMGNVHEGLGMEEADRRIWAEVYGDAAKFLRRAFDEMCG